MYNSSLFFPQSLLPALAVRPEPSLLQPLVTRFQQALRLFFLVLVCLFFAAPQASGQVTFFSKPGFSGVESKLNIGSSSSNSQASSPRGIGFQVASMKVLKGTKVEIYFQTGRGGSSVIYCAGDYHIMPLGTDLTGVKSFNVLKNPSDNQVVTIEYYMLKRYHITAPFQDDVNSKYFLEKIGVLQNLSFGTYQKSNLLYDIHYGITEKKDYDENYVRRYWQYKPLQPVVFTIPPGVLLEITGDKTFTFPLGGPSDNSLTVDISIYPDLYKKITEIRVMNPSYVVKSVKMEEDKSYPPNDEKTTVNTINTRNPSNTTPISIGQQLEFSSTVSSTNEWSSTRSYSIATGVAVGASFSASVEGAPAGVGVTATATASIEASVTESVENSLSKGRSETEEKSYTVSPNCNVECPPRTSCDVSVTATQRTKRYNVTTTLMQWDPVKKRTIPGTEKTETSKLTLVNSVDASCELDEEKIPVDLESLTDNEKYAVLLKESSLKYKDQYTATTNFINDQKLDTKGYIHRTEGKVLSSIYYELVDDTEKEKLRALNIYAKYDEDTDRNSYITVASSTSINEIVDPKGYSLYSEDGLGYIYESDPDGTKTVPLILFKSNVGEKYLTTTNSKGKRGYKKVRIEGYVIPK